MRTVELQMIVTGLGFRPTSYRIAGTNFITPDRVGTYISPNGRFFVEIATGEDFAGDSIYGISVRDGEKIPDGLGGLCRTKTEILETLNNIASTETERTTK